MLAGDDRRRACGASAADPARRRAAQVVTIHDLFFLSAPGTHQRRNPPRLRRARASARPRGPMPSSRPTQYGKRQVDRASRRRRRAHLRLPAGRAGVADARPRAERAAPTATSSFSARSSRARTSARCSTPMRAAASVVPRCRGWSLPAARDRRQPRRGSDASRARRCRTRHAPRLRARRRARGAVSIRRASS